MYITLLCFRCQYVFKNILFIYKKNSLLEVTSLSTITNFFTIIIFNQRISPGHILSSGFHKSNISIEGTKLTAKTNSSSVIFEKTVFFVLSFFNSHLKDRYATLNGFNTSGNFKINFFISKINKLMMNLPACHRTEFGDSNFQAAYISNLYSYK